MPRFWRIILHFFKLISYLVRYQWAYIQGLVKPRDEFTGLAYEEMVPVYLDEITEQVLAVCKEYNISYEHAMDKMYYPDITVMYAKMANENAFKTYNDWLNLDETSQGKFVTDYGTPKPYVYEILTPDKQKEGLEKQEKSRNTLKDMYRHGGRIND